MTISVQNCKIMSFSDLPYSKIFLFNKPKVCGYVCVCVGACMLYLQPSAESDKEVQKLLKVLFTMFNAHFVHLLSTNFQIASPRFLSTFKLSNFPWMLFLPSRNMGRFLGVHVVFGCLGLFLPFSGVWSWPLIPTSAGCINEWICTSILPYALMACTWTIYIYVMSLIPTNAEFTNEWICTSILPYPLMAWTWTILHLCYVTHAH